MTKKVGKKSAGSAKAGQSGPITAEEFVRARQGLQTIVGRLGATLESMSRMELADLRVFGWKRIDRALVLALDFADEVEVALLKAKQQYDREHPEAGVSDACQA